MKKEDLENWWTLHYEDAIEMGRPEEEAVAYADMKLADYLTREEEERA